MAAQHKRISEWQRRGGMALLKTRKAVAWRQWHRQA